MNNETALASDLGTGDASPSLTHLDSYGVIRSYQYAKQAFCAAHDKTSLDARSNSSQESLDVFGCVRCVQFKFNPRERYGSVIAPAVNINGGS